MRWFLGVAGIVAGLAGLVFGVGFILRPELTVTRTAEIGRPASALYPMVANLRSFNEISPFLETDPSAAFSFEGAPGAVGQRAIWKASRDTLPDGAMEITGLTPDAEVRAKLTLGDVRSENVFSFAPATKGAIVSWSRRQSCDPSPLQIACRYSLLAARGALEADADLALRKLKTIAEGDVQLAADFSGLAVEFIDQPARDFAFQEIKPTLEPLMRDAAERGAGGFVAGFMAANGMTRAGPLTVVTLKIDRARNVGEYRVGYSFSGPSPINSAGVRAGQLPASRVAQVVIDAKDVDAIDHVSQRLQAYLRAWRITPAGEVGYAYLSRGGEAPKPAAEAAGDAPATAQAARVQVFVPVAASQ
jgi:hypothetical protein